jgi:hypothetical protein
MSSAIRGLTMKNLKVEVGTQVKQKYLKKIDPDLEEQRE